MAPGQVQLLGIDMWNGTPAQVQDFKNATGATYPLLLDGTRPEGGNVQTLYGPYDNHVVIDAEGVIRYLASDIYSHGNRYHLDEIRAAVNVALATPTRTASWSALKRAFAR